MRIYQKMYADNFVGLVVGFNGLLYSGYIPVK